MRDFLTWGTLAGVLAAISCAFYLIPVLWGRLQAVLAAWAIWAVIGWILLASYKATGAEIETTLLMAWVGAISPTLVFVVSVVRLLIQHGFAWHKWGWTRLETHCTILAILTLLAWKSTDIALAGLLGALAVDFLAAIPQIRKSWQRPAEEAWHPWLIFTAAAVVNIFAVTDHTIGAYVYPVFMAVMSFLIALPVVIHRYSLKRLQRA